MGLAPWDVGAKNESVIGMRERRARLGLCTCSSECDGRKGKREAGLRGRLGRVDFDTFVSYHANAPTTDMPAAIDQESVFCLDVHKLDGRLGSEEMIGGLV